MSKSRTQNNDLTKILLAFMDEFVQRYLILEDLTIITETNIPANGYSSADCADQDLVLFNFKSGVPQRKSIENEIKVIIELNEYNYSNPDGNTLFRVMMSFMDHFVNEYTIIENTHKSNSYNFHKNGYRYDKQRNRSNISYSFSGIQPSRDEIERQVMAFIQLKNL